MGAYSLYSCTLYKLFFSAVYEDSYNLNHNTRVIFSTDVPWKHEDVNTLVVDECSLVSVSTFSFLIELLQENAKLRKVILLGDVRQLPSIEPGNFLTDTFNSLARIGEFSGLINWKFDGTLLYMEMICLKRCQCNLCPTLNKRTCTFCL